MAGRVAWIITVSTLVGVSCGSSTSTAPPVTTARPAATSTAPVAAPSDTASSGTDIPQPVVLSEAQTRQLMVDLIKRTCTETNNTWTDSPRLFDTAAEYKQEGHREYKLTDDSPLARLKTAFFDMYATYDAAKDVSTLPAGFCSQDPVKLVAALPASFMQS